MNKKILIGCFGAAVIIVLTLFTSVVGTQTTENLENNVSPLFEIRTERAIEIEVQKMKCSFIGENNRFFVPRPEIKRIYRSEFPTQLGEWTCSPGDLCFLEDWPSLILLKCRTNSICLTFRPICWWTQD